MTSPKFSPAEKALIEYCLEQQASEFNDEEVMDMNLILSKLEKL